MACGGKRSSTSGETTRVGGLPGRSESGTSLLRQPPGIACETVAKRTQDVAQLRLQNRVLHPLHPIVAQGNLPGRRRGEGAAAASGAAAHRRAESRSTRVPSNARLCQVGLAFDRHHSMHKPQCSSGHLRMELGPPVSPRQSPRQGVVEPSRRDTDATITGLLAPAKRDRPSGL